MTCVKYEEAPKDGVIPSRDVGTVMYYFDGIQVQLHVLDIKRVQLPILTLDQMSAGVELMREREVKEVLVYAHPILENMGCCIGFN